MSTTAVTPGESGAAGCPEEDLIRRSVAAFNAGDAEGYLAGFSPDSLRWVSGLDTPLTINDIRANLTLLTCSVRPTAPRRGSAVRRKGFRLCPLDAAGRPRR
jgi:hypothetical protein